MGETATAAAAEDAIVPPSGEEEIATLDRSIPVLRCGRRPSQIYVRQVEEVFCTGDRILLTGLGQGTAFKYFPVPLCFFLTLFSSFSVVSVGFPAEKATEKVVNVAEILRHRCYSDAES
jgi:hypothetical protein